MALSYGRAGRLTAENGGFRPGQSFKSYFFETLGPAIASAVLGAPPSPPSPAPPRYQPRVIMPPVQGGDPGPFMDRVSGPAFLHLPGTAVLMLATMNFADNVMLTRSTDLGAVRAALGRLSTLNVSL